MRLLVQEANCVVYGKVVRITESESRESIAHLVVEEILKGKILFDTIKISFYDGIMCPAPAHYEKDKKYLAFLNKNSNEFITYARSYGVKELTEKEYSVFKLRVSEIQLLFASNNKHKQNESLADWLVKCCKNPLTLWDGAFDILYGDSYDEKKHQIQIKLTKTHKKELKNTLISVDTIGYEYIPLVDVISEFDKKTALNWLINQLLKYDHPHMASEFFLIPRIAELSDKTEVKKIAKEIATSFTKTEEEKAILIAEFKQKL